MVCYEQQSVVVGVVVIIIIVIIIPGIHLVHLIIAAMLKQYLK